MVKRDVNMGTLIPVFLFLLGQTVAAVYWAGRMNEAFEGLDSNVVKFQRQSDTENARQWVEINANEVLARELATRTSAVAATMDSIQQGVIEVRKDLRDINTLLLNKSRDQK